jgi:hypothetical protein
MCRTGDDEQTILRSSTHKARIAHVCNECRRAIMPGESYASTFMVFEGLGHTFKVCAHCGVMCQWLVKNCDGYVFDQVIEDIDEHALAYEKTLPEISAALAALTNGAAKKWADPAGGLMPIPAVPAAISADAMVMA